MEFEKQFDEKMKEIVQEIMLYLNCAYNIRSQGLQRTKDESEINNKLSEYLEKSFSQAIEEERKRMISKMKKYWYSYGRWHNAFCEFVMRDEGICTCKNKQILNKINKAD